MARYRKIYPLIWMQLRGMSESEKLITFYCLCGDQTNRLGIYNFSLAKAAEDIEIPLKKFQKAFEKVLEIHGWKYDSQGRVLFIPSWWKYNPPENEKAFIGYLKDLEEVAPSKLIDFFLSNKSTLPDSFFDRLSDRLSATKKEPIRQPTPYQEQEQEQEYTPLPPSEMGDSFKSKKLNPRAEGTNPRARGTNPRAVARRRPEKFRRVDEMLTLENAERLADPDCPNCQGKGRREAEVRGQVGIVRCECVKVREVEDG